MRGANSRKKRGVKIFGIFCRLGMSRLRWNNRQKVLKILQRALEFLKCLKFRNSAGELLIICNYFLAGVMISIPSPRANAES